MMVQVPAARSRLVKITGYCLATTFAVVGVVFASIPADVLRAFNWLAGGLGWPETTADPYTLYLGLALGYMYFVTVLAWQMARHPQVRWFPWMLVQAKGASALICLFLFALQNQYLIYLANALVDGAIAVAVWALCLSTVAYGDESRDAVEAGPGRRSEAGQAQQAGSVNTHGASIFGNRPPRR